MRLSGEGKDEGVVVEVVGGGWLIIGF